MSLCPGRVKTTIHPLGVAETCDLGTFHSVTHLLPKSIHLLVCLAVHCSTFAFRGTKIVLSNNSIGA